jgi:hypothetical protein
MEKREQDKGMKRIKKIRELRMKIKKKRISNSITPKDMLLEENKAQFLVEYYNAYSHHMVPNNTSK